jgi:hypothetical protein
MNPQDWHDAQKRLPRAYSLPVEVEMAGGKKEIRVTTTGDWREVVRWRTANMDDAEIKRLRKEQKIAMSELDAAG